MWAAAAAELCHSINSNTHTHFMKRTIYAISKFDDAIKKTVFPYVIFIIGTYTSLLPYFSSALPTHMHVMFTSHISHHHELSHHR
jgi:hypothetical protein